MFSTSSIIHINTIIGIVIIPSLQGVITRNHHHESHCKVSLQGIIIMQGVIARSHESHCKLQGAKCMESSASCKCKELSASCKCKESSARSQVQVGSAWSQVQVASAWSQVQVASARGQAQVASARSQVQLTCEELKSLLRAAG